MASARNMMPLVRIPEPVDAPDWLFELKHVKVMASNLH
jgi:hypothetical protein